jgi:CrcB protein
MSFLLVFLGGGLGSLARYGVSLATAQTGLAGFPYATLAVNVVGGFAMGLLVGVLAARAGPMAAPELRLFLATGFLGGFTTFSAFSLEAVELWQRGQGGLAALYVGLSVVLALGALAGGLALAKVT